MEVSGTYPADKQVAEALRWISEVRARTGAQYQVVGGLAARAYGATRPLIDLDFYVPAQDLPRVLASVRDSWVWGPEHFRDENWDLTFAKLKKHGVQIELARRKELDTTARTPVGGSTRTLHSMTPKRGWFLEWR